jgi:hypothetical protein
MALLWNEYDMKVFDLVFQFLFSVKNQINSKSKATTTEE